MLACVPGIRNYFGAVLGAKRTISDDNRLDNAPWPARRRRSGHHEAVRLSFSARSLQNPGYSRYFSVRQPQVLESFRVRTADSHQVKGVANGRKGAVDLVIEIGYQARVNRERGMGIHYVEFPGRRLIGIQIAKLLSSPERGIFDVN